MKENFTIHNLITFIAAVSFFAPLGVLLYKKLIKHPFFSWFAFYWTFCGAVNLLFLSGWVTEPAYLALLSDVFNYTDGLLMLFLLYKTLDIPKLRRRAGYILAGFAALSTAGILIRGFREAVVVIIGVAVALILLQLISIVVHYLTSTSKYHVGSSRLLLYYALFFEYGTSIFTYMFSYVFINMNVMQDSFLLYHVSIIISTTLGCFAIAFNKRKSPPRRKQTRAIEQEVEIQFL